VGVYLGVSHRPRKADTPMPLTDVAIRRAKPADKPQKLSDAGGLCLYITVAGAKSWRWKYRFGGRRRCWHWACTQR
jgi:hypothetical protein